MSSPAPVQQLTVSAYVGDGNVLLAFNFEQEPSPDFAGFAVKRTDPKGASEYLPNRLSFDKPITQETTGDQRQSMITASEDAPFQKFYWVDFPPDVINGVYTYDIEARYFAGDGKSGKDGAPALETRETGTVKVQLCEPANCRCHVAFTRGYLSSQAYATKFQNKPIRPAKKSITYNTKPFEEQYCWLGYEARRILFEFVQECLDDESITVDLFAYDLDEPDFIRDMVKLGKRLRAFLDNAPLHTKPDALEIPAHAALVKSAGAKNVKQGHFKRFAHCKVLVLKKNGKPVKVLTGSANFSVRGLYVQANNVIVFDDPPTAELYEQAFEEAFNDMSGFADSEIAEGYHPIQGDGLPTAAVAFSPHTEASVSLDVVAKAIQNAKSSVLFAIMELSGGGPVMDAIRNLSTEKVFTYGMTQSLTGVKVYKPGDLNGVMTGFAFLAKQVPAPFQKEFSGGPGQVIHHKFVVVDFNGDNPVVFTGSSNLASGGEQANGDNLIMIRDKRIAQLYGVEAIRLVDHYHFRAAMQSATEAAPMVLQAGGDKPWFADAYQPGVKENERLLFTHGEQQPTVARAKPTHARH